MTAAELWLRLLVEAARRLRSTDAAQRAQARELLRRVADALAERGVMP